MFTGLVETLGVVEQVQPSGPGCRLHISAPPIIEGTQLGDSVAINGACLTIHKISATPQSDGSW